MRKSEKEEPQVHNSRKAPNPKKQGAHLKSSAQSNMAHPKRSSSQNQEKRKLSNRQIQKREQKEQKLEKKRSGNKQIILITYVFVGLFILLIANFVNFIMVDSKEQINNSYNKRQSLLAERVVRGKILSRNGEVLAETITDQSGKEIRKYPYNNMFCHVVGHFSQGQTGIELYENFNLLTSNNNLLSNLTTELSGKKTIGDNIITTLDVNLQKVAYDALGNYKGAIVVMEPSTGKILAMVSKPDYDPNPSSLDSKWSDFVKDTSKNSYLLNRATQGLYPPGSTFKILTALEYLRENHNDKNYQYTCHGKELFGDVTINCYRNKIHGAIDLKESFAKSCNCSFANIGMHLNRTSFLNSCNKFLFNVNIPIRLLHNNSSFVLSAKSDSEETLHTAMGQGKTQITPLHSAMIVSAIANKGKLMTPYVVDRTENSNGNIVRKTNPKVYTSPLTEEEASMLTDYMTAVIDNGTATSLRGLGYSVAGKTGSAEFDSTKASHSWFLGFAPADNPQIAVSIIVEGMGTGSEYAVPISKKIFQAYLNK